MGAGCRMAAAPALGRHTLRRRRAPRSNHAMEPRRWCSSGGAIARRRRDRTNNENLCSRIIKIRRLLGCSLCLTADGVTVQEGELLSRLRVEAGRRLVRAAAERSWPPPR